MYNVDDNGRDVIQPALFSTYHDMANMGQLSMCNKMSQALNKSSSPPTITRVFMMVWEGIQAMKLGVRLKETHTLWNIRDLNHHTGILKVVSGELPFIRYQVFLWRRVFILERRLIIAVNTVKLLINLQNLFNSRLFRIHRKNTSVRYVGKTTNSSNLSRHRKVSIGRKPFKCTQCDKAFICHSLLTPHQITHTGEKGYKCTECAKPLFPVQILVNITELIWGRCIINV